MPTYDFVHALREFVKVYYEGDEQAAQLLLRCAKRLDSQQQKLDRIAELLTQEVLTELGSEAHEILIPQYTDEIRTLLHG